MKTNLKYFLILLTYISCAACQPVRTVKVTVIDDDQKPIKDAKVLVGFVGDDKGIEGLTDENGVYEASAQQPLLRMLTRVNKEGYYETEKDRLRKDQDHDLTLVLRKKKNPIPLFAKRWRIVTDHTDENLGFDFSKGDWVKPFGKGETVDIFFKIHIERIDFWTFTYRLDVSFPNEFDGIQTFETIENSELKSPYLAPEDGYKRTWVHTASRKGKNVTKETNGDYHRNYWMRVRSQVDDQGNLVSANYIKIYGNFPDLHYYFNPIANDRNLEFDTGRNLMKGLDLSESVIDP